MRRLSSLAFSLRSFPPLDGSQHRSLLSLLSRTRACPVRVALDGVFHTLAPPVCRPRVPNPLSPSLDALNTPKRNDLTRCAYLSTPSPGVPGTLSLKSVLTRWIRSLHTPSVLGGHIIHPRLHVSISSCPLLVYPYLLFVTHSVLSRRVSFPRLMPLRISLLQVQWQRKKRRKRTGRARDHERATTSTTGPSWRIERMEIHLLAHRKITNVVQDGSCGDMQ